MNDSSEPVESSSTRTPVGGSHGQRARHREQHARPRSGCRWRPAPPAATDVRHRRDRARDDAGPARSSRREPAARRPTNTGPSQVAYMIGARLGGALVMLGEALGEQPGAPGGTPARVGGIVMGDDHDRPVAVGVAGLATTLYVAVRQQPSHPPPAPADFVPHRRRGVRPRPRPRPGTADARPRAPTAATAAPPLTRPIGHQ